MERLLPIMCCAVLALPVLATEAPLPVSPASPNGIAAVASPCPTFSWTSLEGAGSYELLVYRVEGGGPTGEPVMERTLPRGASSWTPSAKSCLEPGGTYAWVVRGRFGLEAGAWADAAVFEVAGMPSIAEVEAALATLRRQLASRTAAATDGEPEEGLPLRARDRLTGRSGDTTTRPRPGFSIVESVSLVPRAAPAPSSTPSLTVSDQIHLDTDSAFVQDGDLFLWTDASNLGLGRRSLEATTGSGNTGIGNAALLSNSVGSSNTAVGDQALFYNNNSHNTALGSQALFSNTFGNFNTATGYRALFSGDGSHNTATGAQALSSNLTGQRNTAVGAQALFENTAGFSNTAVGDRALENITEGATNVGLGALAGTDVTTGSNNIFISNEGIAGDSSTIRIGSNSVHFDTFVAGIHGADVNESTNLPVLADHSGKLGTTTSSLRFKEGIVEVGEASELLLELRPVKFRFKKQQGRGQVQYGLIAEEVAEVFPELVVRDRNGEPLSVRYHVLVPLLLAELQRQEGELEHALQRVGALEAGHSRSPGKTPWWRRFFGSRGSPSGR